jgi:hypothetical protein
MISMGHDCVADSANAAAPLLVLFTCLLLASLATTCPAASSSAAVGAASRRGAAAVAESDGRHSPPPVDPSEVAGGELEVVNEEEDARMLELLRAQVRLECLTICVCLLCM